MVEQHVPVEAAVVPALGEDDRREIKEKVRRAAQEAERLSQGKRCIVCGEAATHCMRGVPNNTYCKPCAKEHFKFLNYLERL